MPNPHTIAHIRARQVLDSRGRPTVEADVELASGITGTASVPSGASTGTYEAHELRDGNPQAYAGLGVLKAVANIHGELARVVKGCPVEDQKTLDDLMVQADGTKGLSRLGANAILAVSLAACRAAATAQGKALYTYIAALSASAAPSMPMPMVNILSGGHHAGFSMDVQDFLVMPVSARNMREALATVGKVRDMAGTLMRQRGLSTLLADEGGLSPGFATSREALELLHEATEKSGLVMGTDIRIAIDVAASSLKDKSSTDATPRYWLPRENKQMSRADMIGEAESWVRDFGVASIEDALDEDDWAGWSELTKQLGASCQLVGDDFFTTNPERVARGIHAGAANGVLVKLNQNGTLSGTLDVIAMARAEGYATIVSARSGETEDDFMADLATGTGAGQIKIGSLRGGERLAKYNRLLRIEDLHGVPFAGFPGRASGGG